MRQHDFTSLSDFHGASLPYITTHHELVRLQREALAARKQQAAAAAAAVAPRVGLAKDDEWSGDGFVAEAESMVSNS